MVTAMRIPVPLPIATIRSVTTESGPRMALSRAAAVGTTRCTLHLTVTNHNLRSRTRASEIPSTCTGENTYLELLGDNTPARTGHLDPSLEDRARGDHERDVDEGVNGVDERSTECAGVHVVSDTRDTYERYVSHTCDQMKT